MADTNGTEPPVAAAIEASPEEVGFKVFVGNISFATKEEELKELFGKHGATTSAQIIHRGPRSLGYGFVTFSTEEAASSAIKALDKTEVNGRTINVEMAKPPEKLKEVARAAAKQAGMEDGKEREAGAEVKVGRGRGRGRARGRGRGGRGRGGARVDGEDVTAEDTAAEATGVTDTAKKTKKRKSKPKKKEGEEGAAVEGGEPRPPKEKKPREPRKPKGPPTGEPSKTLLFVANLPFSIEDDGLSELFTSLSPPLTVTSAHIVRRKGKRTGNRSKGFGFVEVANEEMQTRAVNELNMKSIGEGEAAREIQVKVAVGTEIKDDDDAEPNGTAAEAVKEVEAATTA